MFVHLVKSFFFSVAYCVFTSFLFVDRILVHTLTSLHCVVAARLFTRTRLRWEGRESFGAHKVHTVWVESSGKKHSVVFLLIVVLVVVDAKLLGSVCICKVFLSADDSRWPVFLWILSKF